MRILVVAMLVGGASMMVTGCGSECETAINKEIECTESEKRKASMEKDKSEIIEKCNKDSDDERMKMMVECGQKSTCAEVKACQLQARSAEDAKEITAAVASGDISKAVRTCSYQLESYQAGGAFKTACDSAFSAAAGKLDDEKLGRSISYLCTGDDGAAWKKGSDAIKTACGSVGDAMKKVLETSRDAGKYEKYKCESYVEYVSKNAPDGKAAAEKFCADAKTTADTKQVEVLKKEIVAQRDAGTKADFGKCYKYKKLAETLPAAEKAAAILLCEESTAAADFNKAMGEVKKAIAAKKKRAPYQCSSFLKKGDEKLKGSKWFATKAPVLAKACYGDLGKIILATVSARLCLSGPKAVHEYATKYNLGASDPTLQALLTKTKPLCVK